MAAPGETVRGQDGSGATRATAMGQMELDADAIDGLEADVVARFRACGLDAHQDFRGSD